MDTAHVDDDHRRRHEAYLTEAAFLIALREHVQRAYGPAPAARRMAPVGLNQRPFWADADGRTATDRHRIREYERTHPHAVSSRTAPPAPPARRPLPPVRPEPAPRPDVAVGLAMTGREADRGLARVRDRLRAALRLRIGEGVMPG